MISTHESFVMKDKQGHHDFTMEVNWKGPDDPLNGKCQIIRVTHPNGDVSYIDRELFHSMLFMISREDQQRDMIPLTIRKVRHHESLITIRVPKACKKGDELTVKATMACDVVREDTVLKKDQAQSIESKAARRGLWVPNKNVVQK